MTPFHRFFLFAAIALPAFPQNPSASDADQLRIQMQHLQAEANHLREQAALMSAAGAYESGAHELDEHRYDDAIRDFDRVIATKSSRAEGALYWRAYALNRLGRRQEAMTTIATLRRDHPKSRWLNDAGVLEVEARQSSGKPVSPADESNEDLKLIAINGLMNADPDQTLPLLEGILKGAGPPDVKDRALFVLTQSKSPRARQILVDLAKGSANPDLQLQAIRYLGIAGGAETQTQLVNIYNSTADADARQDILNALFAAGAFDKLATLAGSEKTPALRAEAIRYIALSGSTKPETLGNLYFNAADVESKRAVIDGLFARADAKDLVPLARKETDPTLKREIIERLAMMHSKEATDYMRELLK